VLLYGYCCGVTSSRRLAQALEDHVAFRFLAANQQPDFRTINDCRKTRLAALEGLFVEVLRLCQATRLATYWPQLRAYAAAVRQARPDKPVLGVGVNRIGRGEVAMVQGPQQAN